MDPQRSSSPTIKWVAYMEIKPTTLVISSQGSIWDTFQIIAILLVSD